ALVPLAVAAPVTGRLVEGVARRVAGGHAARVNVRRIREARAGHGGHARLAELAAGPIDLPTAHVRTGGRPEGELRSHVGAARRRVELTHLAGARVPAALVRETEGLAVG